MSGRTAPATLDAQRRMRRTAADKVLRQRCSAVLALSLRLAHIPCVHARVSRGAMMHATECTSLYPHTTHCALTQSMFWQGATFTQLISAHCPQKRVQMLDRLPRFLSPAQGTPQHMRYGLQTSLSRRQRHKTFVSTYSWLLPRLSMLTLLLPEERWM